MKNIHTRDWINAAICPTQEFTKSSSKKWVRALGEIGVIIPMLPWTIFAGTTIVVFGIVVVIPVGALIAWYDNV